MDDVKWFKDIFRPHFDKWVMEPIDRLVISQDALIGFIFMSCAIDYLASFLWGSSRSGQIGTSYKKFIDDYFPKDRYDAQGLYDSLRCGLVHMFTIKDKKYSLTHNHPELHLKTDSTGKTTLNAGNFRDDLVAAKNKYFDEVEKRADLLEKVTLRFIRDGFLDLEKQSVNESFSKELGEFILESKETTVDVSGAVLDTDKLGQEEMIVVKLVKTREE